MAFIKIKPAKGMRVPMPGGYGLPVGTPLPADGFSVPSDPFTRRLLADGDAVLIKEPAATPAAGTAAPAADAPAADGAASNGSGPADATTTTSSGSAA